MINEFIAQFTDKPFSKTTKIGKKYFLASNDLLDFCKKNNLTVESVGVFLGEERKERFMSSLVLLDMLSNVSDRKMVIDAKSEWLFLCGRDIMAGSIIRSNVDEGFVLIQNEKDINLGLGKIVGRFKDRPNAIVVKNIIDKGDYLRREMDH